MSTWLLCGNSGVVSMTQNMHVMFDSDLKFFICLNLGVFASLLPSFLLFSLVLFSAGVELDAQI